MIQLLLKKAARILRNHQKPHFLMPRFPLYNTTDEIGNSNEKLNNGVTYFQADLLTIYVFFHGKIGMYG